MRNGILQAPYPDNESVQNYLKGSDSGQQLRAELNDMHSEMIEIPVIIGGKKIFTGNTGTVRSPHEHHHVLATFHKCGPREVEQAIEAAGHAWKNWSQWAWQDRAAVFLKAAELLAGPYRNVINSATMLGQSKNTYQSEIDAACETIDFLRFNTYYMTQLYSEQPANSPNIWNTVEYRPLEGFVFSITPFNFTSIAANLVTAPALMGNVVLWKPATTSLLSSYYIMQLLQDAGLPPGVVNFLPGTGSDIGKQALSHPDLAGIHFTGSTRTFNHLWRTVGQNIDGYRGYPRLVGETGGKDFVVIHPSAELDWTATALADGAFGYQGQKCSAAGRAYIPESVWPAFKKGYLDRVASMKMGDVRDFDNCINAVIDANAFKSISDYIDFAEKSSDMTILYGGKRDDSDGYFVQPTIVQSLDPYSKLMTEEIFGPVLTVYVYPDSQFEDILDVCNKTSPYALTGSIFATDRAAIIKAFKTLRHAAGNFYVNDKPTGAVVGQQPFGGSRKSGTNDKAGSKANLQRWVSTRTIKETFTSPPSWICPRVNL
jgi:1-pyrroline-5-carboxylate dehydrogenase